MIIMAAALLILFGATVILQADLLPDKKFVLLPPVNFTIKITGLAQVLLRWEPDPHQEQRNVNLGYRVRINAPQEDDYETRDTESQCVTILHKGFSASVQTIFWNEHSLPASSWVSAEMKDPPGSPGTSIANLTCTTNTVENNYVHLRRYQVSLRCTWLVGQDAPEDTQYFLYYRYGSWTEECQEYNKDTLKRNTACWFPRTFINSKGRDRLVVHVNGSSRHAAIKPFDQLFDLHAIGNDEPTSSLEWFIIALMAAICFVLLIFSFICRICHVWTKLFPPVPAPKSNIKDLFVSTNYEKAGSNETEIEDISYVEEAGFEILEDSVF
ncbi:interleukin-5 receptor subunit alpha isoform X3 [Trichechus manatus latirostris]|uniref:Interleukin-5 receptor subunit alpha isoform X3 n=1 Tax=Trichechus manatus latirostris TaxID=127582 RepID=A0A2Y9RCL1_TRIMA|nr:interleukin-5 receptor subunit alpha isoform X3 [Trichechus manatus latirostris]